MHPAPRHLLTHPYAGSAAGLPCLARMRGISSWMSYRAESGGGAAFGGMLSALLQALKATTYTIGHS